MYPMDVLEVVGPKIHAQSARLGPSSIRKSAHSSSLPRMVSAASTFPAAHHP